MSRRISHVYDPGLGKAREEVRALLSAGLDIEGKSLLDVGCGPGIFAQALLEAKAGRVFGLDVEAENVNLAAQRLSGRSASFLQTNVEKFETIERFDIVFARGVLYYCHDVQGVITHLLTVLRPGGGFFATFTVPTFRAKLLNAIKKIAVEMPACLQPALRETAAAGAYLAMTVFGEQADWREVRQKASTLFYPHLHFFAREQALKLFSDCGLGEARVVERPGTTLSDEFAVLAWFTEG